MKKIFNIIILISFLGLFACSQGSKDLDVILKDESLCFFTNDPKTNYYDSNNEFLLYMSKYERKAEIFSEFEQSFKNHKLPIKQEDCLKIPLDKFKKNVSYSVVLDASHTYSTEICVKDENNKLVIKKIEAGKTICD